MVSTVCRVLYAHVCVCGCNPDGDFDVQITSRRSSRISMRWQSTMRSTRRPSVLRSRALAASEATLFVLVAGSLSSEKGGSAYSARRHVYSCAPACCKHVNGSAAETVALLLGQWHCCCAPPPTHTHSHASSRLITTLRGVPCRAVTATMISGLARSGLS